MVERGELHLGAIHLLAGHLTAENHSRVLERAKHRSCRDVERLIAELAPRADVPSRIRAIPGLRRAGAHAGGHAAARSSEVAAMSSDAASVPSGAGGIANDVALTDHDQAAGTADHPLSAAGELVSPGSGVLSRGTSQTGAATKPIVPLSPRRYKIEITVDEATHDKLRSLQDLLGRSGTGRDPAAIISRAIDVLLDRTLARRAGFTDRPKPTHGQCADSISPATGAAPSQRGQRLRMDPATVQRGPRARAIPQTMQRQQRTRTIPAAVRREVWRRDCGRCCYMDSLGRRCATTSNVEFHHRTPFAVGGEHTAQNVELRCAAHNQYQADLDFGRSFMDGRRGKAAPTFHGECQAATAP